MTPHEEQKIIQWSKGLINDLEITLRATKDERSEHLRMFCNELSGLASKIKIKELQEENVETPFFEIGTNIRYFAVPSGPELESFLKSLTLYDEAFVFLPQAIKGRIQNLERPVLLRIFISQQCPHCTKSVQQLISLAIANELISIEIIDGTLFWELAQAENIQCVPTVLYGDDFRWSGVTPLGDIVEVLGKRDSSGLSVAAIERMFEEGNALKVARMMLEKEEMFPAVFELMVDERFLMRVGAMAVMDEVVNQNLELASEAVIPLWRRFEAVIEPMQIDILYFMGDAGSKETVSLLETVLNGDHRDHVKEAATEAIDCIRNRSQMN